MKNTYGNVVETLIKKSALSDIIDLAEECISRYEDELEQIDELYEETEYEAYRELGNAYRERLNGYYEAVSESKGEVKKYNPYHDEKGRFSSKNNAKFIQTASSAISNAFNGVKKSVVAAAKQHRIWTEKKRKTKIELAGRLQKVESAFIMNTGNVKFTIFDKETKNLGVLNADGIKIEITENKTYYEKEKPKKKEIVIGDVTPPERIDFKDNNQKMLDSPEEIKLLPEPRKE